MSQTRFLKSMITSTKVEPTSSDTHIAGVASGVWSLQDQLEARRGGTWPDANVANPDTLIENNFSLFLYTGNGSTQTITNNLDFSGGGLLWIKARNDGGGPQTLMDTARGANSSLRSSATDDAMITTSSQDLVSFNNNGFSLA